jgi:methyl-accepting chemotaxis protein
MSERRGQIIISVALSALCCAAIAGITLLIYLKLVNAPVRRLMRAMRDFEKDAANFNFSGGDIAVSEISELSYSFGLMSKKIKELMLEIEFIFSFKS